MNWLVEPKGNGGSDNPLACSLAFVIGACSGSGLLCSSLCGADCDLCAVIYIYNTPSM